MKFYLKSICLFCFWMIREKKIITGSILAPFLLSSPLPLSFFFFTVLCKLVLPDYVKIDGTRERFQI